MTYKANKKWNLWRIKTPLLRLPVAWVFSAISIVVYAVMIFICALIGAVVGIKDGALEGWRVADFRMLWVASTTWRKP